MDQNNNHLNTQNSTNYPSNYQNHNNYQFQNQSFNQIQNVPKFCFPLNFSMALYVTNYCSYYGSVMPYSFPPPTYYSTFMGNVNIPNVITIEFPGFSKQGKKNKVKPHPWNRSTKN